MHVVQRRGLITSFRLLTNAVSVGIIRSSIHGLSISEVLSVRDAATSAGKYSEQKKKLELE